MNNKINLSSKKYICIVAFILTFNFSFAYSNSEKNIDPIFNTQALKIFTNPNSTNTAAALTFSYDVATFCAGATGYSKPKVSEDGGVFSFKKNSDGRGSLAINLRTGIIDQYISDSGEYTVTYSKGGTTLSTIVKVNSCK